MYTINESDRSDSDGLELAEFFSECFTQMCDVSEESFCEMLAELPIVSLEPLVPR